MTRRRKPAWNWLRFLEGAIKKEPSVEVYQEACRRAGTWPTCAVGALCGGLERLPDGCPADRLILLSGFRFQWAVDDRRWANALATFHAIESRTAELLAEQRKAKK